MSRNVEFYRCEVCGNIVELIHKGGGQLVCCGKPMTKLMPGAVDAALEKHVPKVQRKDGKIIVEVGSVLHPMLEEHYIMWIEMVFEGGTQRVWLSPGEAPTAVFEDKGDATIYEYCNLHGLWSADI